MSKLFSIVIPTFNRSHLLKYSLASVIEQARDDLEIIVSDDNSTDDTELVIQTIGDGRVRHIKPPVKMSMADHFEWASAQTSGEYVLFLCDDDVLVPNALQTIADAIEKTNAKVLALNSAVYVFPDWDGGEQQNSLSYTLYSPRLVKCASDKVLNGLFNLKPNFATPRGNNSFTHRSVIEMVRAKIGRFFLHPAPDMSSCAAVLGVVDSYIFISIPLHVWGVSTESIGAIQGAKGGEQAEKSKEAFGDKDFFELSPFKVYCPSNIWAESMLQVKKLLPDEYPEVNLAALYKDCLKHLRFLEKNNFPIEDELAELLSTANKLGLRQYSESFTQLIISRLTNSSLAGPLLRLKHFFAPPEVPMNVFKKEIVSGRVGGFNNILDSARFLAEMTAKHNFDV